MGCSMVICQINLYCKTRFILESYSIICIFFVSPSTIYHFYKLFWREVMVELELSNWIGFICMKLSVHLGIVEEVLSLTLCLSFFANNLAFNFL